MTWGTLLFLTYVYSPEESLDLLGQREKKLSEDILMYGDDGFFLLKEE